MMKAVGPTLGKIMLVIFGMAVFGLMIILTFSALGRIFPNDLIKQATGLILFDIGALVWLVVFAYASRGAMQRSIALLLFFFCVAGAVTMAGSDAIMSGQQFVEIPEWLGQIIVYVYIVAVAMNLIALYLHHLNSPDLATTIRMQGQEDHLIALALDEADRQLEEERHELSSALSVRYKQKALVSLNLINPADIIEAKFRNGTADKKSAVKVSAEKPLITPDPTQPKSGRQ